MSRIRSVHPGVWTDDAFMALSAHARLLIIGIWTEAFDDGVFEWKPLTLKARIFAADNVDVPALLEELVAGDFIRREEFGGRPIGLVRNFREYQRPKKPNSSAMFRPEWGTYVGMTVDGGEPVPNQSETGGEKSPQMEDGGGRVEEEDKASPPVLVAEGARVSFEDVKEAFPRNPSSSDTEAQAAWDRTKPEDRPLILEAAQRRAKWFGQDCEARDRTVEEGLRFEPHLAKWLAGKWRDSLKLPLKGESNQPIVPMTQLDRLLHARLFAACERIGRGGKRAPADQWSFPNSVVERAKAELDQPQAVH